MHNSSVRKNAAIMVTLLQRKMLLSQDDYEVHYIFPRGQCKSMFLIPDNFR